MTRARASRQPDSESLSFVEFLETSLRESPPAQKGARTRARLKIATASVLQASGYHAMRVTDITAAAGLAEGSFYVYFEDKKDAALQTLSAYLREFVDLRAPLELTDMSYESVREANRRWLAVCRANAGLMRCVSQLAEDDVDFAGLMHQIQSEWYDRIASQYLRGESDRQTVLLAVYMIGSMTDEIIRKLIVFPDPAFAGLLDSIGADDTTIADILALFWVQTFEPDSAPPRNLSPVAERLANMMWPKRRSAPARKARRRPAPTGARRQ